jgi:N-acetylmuramoyl-L-alanine amidase
MAVQLALLRHGYKLPRKGADGHLGDETWGALRQFAKDHNILWPPAVPEPVLAALASRPVEDDTYDLTLVKDLSSMQCDPPEVTKKHKLIKGVVVKRDLKAIRGIVLHQTKSIFSVNAVQIKVAGNNREEALHRRGLRVGCHVIAFEGTGAEVDCGHVCYVNQLAWYVYHAQKANSFSVGLEIEGKFPEFIQNGQLLASPRLIEAARLALKFIVTKARELGMDNLEFIWAHRQMSSKRPGDPGQELWKRVVLDYAVPVLGLKTDTKATWDDGRPIPREWDSSGTAYY